MKRLFQELNIAFRNLHRQRNRSFFSVMVVTFAITALILADGFIEWTLVELRESTIKSQLGHLQIVKPGYHEFGKSDPYNFLLPEAIPEVFSKDLKQISVITPRLYFSGLISNGEETITFIAEGVEPEGEKLFEDALEIIEGNNLSIEHKYQIIVGNGLAQNLGLKVDNKVVLMVSTAMGGFKAIEVEVAGLFVTITKSYDDNAIRLPIATAHELLRIKGSHSWVVLLDDTHSTDSVLAKLNHDLPESEFEIIPWYKLSDFYNKTLILFSKQILGIKVVIVLIILLSISNTIIINVVERISEIGTYMALGVKRLGIVRLFLYEAILIALIGSVAGIVIGIILANIISIIGIPMPPPPGMALEYKGEILVTEAIILESLIFSLGASLIASIFPVWKASRMNIANALRYNQ